MTCPRCQGLVLENHGEQACVNCGWFPGCPVRPVGPDGEDVSELCVKCGVKPKALYREHCRGCLDRARGWQRAMRKSKRTAQEKVAGPSAT